MEEKTTYETLEAIVEALEFENRALKARLNSASTVQLSPVEGLVDTFLKNAPIAVYIKNRQHIYTMVNKQAAEWLGASKKEIEGKKYREVSKQEEYVGDVRITRLQPEMSAADLIPPLSIKSVKKNDQVKAK